jgi:hypothetical protein
VQDVPYGKLREQLLKDGQILHFDGPVSAEVGGLDPSSLKGIVVDDEDAKLVGGWRSSQAAKTYVGDGYRHDNNMRDGRCRASFEAKLPKAGKYEVRLASPPNANRCAKVRVEVHHAAGTKMLDINQQTTPPIDGIWHSLGVYQFATDKPALATISNEAADGYVVIDAVQFLPSE